MGIKNYRMLLVLNLCRLRRYFVGERHDVNLQINLVVDLGHLIS